MNRKLLVLALAFSFALPMRTLLGEGGPEKGDAQKWEFKTVLFTTNEEEGTEKLNKLAESGWQYVGPLGNGLVAFRRHALPLNQIIVDVVANPRSVAAGEKTTITVKVRGGDYAALQGANVSVAAGGGKFLPTADTPFDPSERLHSPYSATGTTGKTGEFTTWWVVNPAAPAYNLGINVSKVGYISAKTDLLIKINDPRENKNNIFP